MDQDPERLAWLAGVLGGGAAFGTIAFNMVKRWWFKNEEEDKPDKFDTLYQMLDGRFRQTDSRLEQINVRLERADTKFEDTHRMLHTVIQETGERLKGVEKDVEHIRLDHGRRLENLEHDRG